jgi:hypothetical protein
MTHSNAIPAQRTAAAAAVQQMQYRDEQRNSEVVGSLLFMLDYMKPVPYLWCQSGWYHTFLTSHGTVLNVCFLKVWVILLIGSQNIWELGEANSKLTSSHISATSYQD